MDTINATNLRKTLYETLARVSSKRVPVAVVLFGHASAVIVPAASRDPDGKKPLVDLDAISAFCEKHEVKTLSLFGSILRADFNASSDVDVLVDLGDKHIDLHEMFRMVDHLEAIFGRRVDMVESSNLGRLDDVRRKEISSTARVIYEQELFDASS